MTHSNLWYPFHSESERNYYAWFGLYTQGWSGLEYGLFALLHILAKQGFGSIEKVSQGTQLTAKLKILRDLFHKHLELGDQRDEFLAIAEFISKESEFRHDLVHGVSAEIYKTDPHYSLTFRPEKLRHLGLPETARRVTQASIEEHYENVSRASMGILALTIRLSTPNAVPNQPSVVLPSA